MSTVGFVCATVSLLGLNKVFLFLLLYGAQDGGLLAALGYPAISAEPVEGEMCWLRSLGSRSDPSGHRPWEPLLERSVTVHRAREPSLRVSRFSSPREELVSASRPVSLPPVYEGALSAEGAGPGRHLEGQRSTPSLFPPGFGERGPGEPRCGRAWLEGVPVWGGDCGGPSVLRPPKRSGLVARHRI